MVRKILSIIISILLIAFAVAITFFLTIAGEVLIRERNATTTTGFSNVYLTASAPVSSPAGLEEEIDNPLLDYCLWDESRDDMSKIGAQGEIGALQYKIRTWNWLCEKYNFNGSIYDRQDQIDLFLIAVEGGDGRHWTCWRKYHNKLCLSQ